MHLAAVLKGRLKVGGADGGSHGRLNAVDGRERCTCGWTSAPLGPTDDGPMVWCDHLIANGTIVPLNDVLATQGARPPS
jgi:hypothetical protein